jgi:tRNA(adenine34) deaminase
MERKSEDIKFAKMCIDLANQAYEIDKDVPFACIIVQNNTIIAKAKNRATKGDITMHAEILALQEAQKSLGNSNLSGCTLYSNVEPCPMCSFMIRELNVSKVCFSLSSPKMGGYSKWPILQDLSLTSITPFGKPPEIVTGVLSSEAKKDFDKMGWTVFE